MTREATAAVGVVRPLRRAAARGCDRPGCPAPAVATLAFRYAEREAWLRSLTAEADPSAYDLCDAHATRTQPPRGWQLRDERAEAHDDGESSPLGGERTVALLGAVLHPAAPPAEVAPQRSTARHRDTSPVLDAGRSHQREPHTVPAADTRRHPNRPARRW